MNKFPEGKITKGGGVVWYTINWCQNYAPLVRGHSFVNTVSVHEYLLDGPKAEKNDN